MVADVVPNGLARPIRHRIQFHDVPADRFVDDINLDDADSGAGGGLLPAQAGDPAIEVAELVLQWQDFANSAAEIRIALPEFRTVDVGLFFNGQVRFE